MLGSPRELGPSGGGGGTSPVTEVSEQWGLGAQPDQPDQPDLEERPGGQVGVLGSPWEPGQEPILEEERTE